MIQIDPRGDAEIRVQNPTRKTETVFAVCSRTLARVSPRWESSFFSLEFEQNRQLSLNVSMNLIETRVLKTILDILHHNTTKIPARMNCPDLVIFLSLGRTYQITSPLSIWGIQFFNNDPILSNSKYRSNRVLMLRMWLANKVGLRDQFHESIRDIASKWKINSDRDFGLVHDGLNEDIRTGLVKDEQCLGTFLLLHSKVKLSNLEA